MKKPNILFILSDDHGAWALGSAGNAEIQTPHLDELAKEGLRFENFFCVSPVCSPARASIVTGSIPSYHGVHDWIASGNVEKETIPEELRANPQFRREEHAIDYLQGHKTYIEELAEAGYSCGLSGKWHLGNSAKPAKGFTYWEAIARGGCHYMHPDCIQEGSVAIEDEYVTDRITRKALHFLDIQREEERPFYLSVHYTAPHTPWDRDQHPQNIWSTYEDCTFKEQPFLPTHPHSRGTCQHADTEAERLELYKGYYTAITAMDKGIGHILAKLEDMGESDNTIIVFTGDNGMNLGHHGIWGKGNGTFPFNMYDTSVKVPFIINYKGLQRRGCCQELVSHYDVYPTLLDLAGVDYPSHDALVGESFMSLLNGEQYWAKDRVVVYDEYGPVRMIRSKEWKYIHRYPYGHNELYHLNTDPEEMINLYDNPKYKELVADMKWELDSWFTTHANPQVDGTREAVTGFGQLNLAGSLSKRKITYSKSYDHNHTPSYKIGPGF